MPRSAFTQQGVAGPALPHTPYSIARAQLIAEQIERFATQHVHQLAGHHASLPFWLAEAAAALQTIDEYPKRFRQLRDAQLSWVREHGTRVTTYCPICRGGCEFGPQTPARPRRLPTEDLTPARECVRRAVVRFLVRLHRTGFISDAEAHRSAALVGVALEPEDLDPEGG